MSTSSKLVYLSSGKSSSGDYFVEGNGSAQMANSYVQLHTPHVQHLISSSSTSTSHPGLSYSTNSALSAQKAAMKLIAASNRLVECSETISSQPPLKKPFHLYHLQPSMSTSMNNLANIETEKGRVE